MLCTSFLIVTATTPASYDYAAASYGRGSGNVGVTFETNKSYYQQATVGQTSSQSTGVGPHVAVPSANTVVSTVVSSDLQNWQGQNFGNRQTCKFFFLNFCLLIGEVLFELS